jgi:hypothetical protein
VQDVEGYRGAAIPTRNPVQAAAPVGEAGRARKLHPNRRSERQGTVLVPHPDARGLLRGERFQISDDVGPLIGVWDALKR